MTDTVIDVLIPAFNAADTIGGAVESIQRQTIREIRIIVVDDGSTDGTAAIVADIARADPRIELHTKANGGIVDALNFGMSHCTSELLARHDADDLAYPERLATQLAYLRANSDCVAVGGLARHINASGHPLGHVSTLHSADEPNPYWAPSREPYIIHPLLMTYRASVEKIGRYRYAFHAEDTDLYWRLRESGRLHNLDQVLCDYRLHAHSVSGASMVNGRISAVNSQLAGISALRRRDHRPDIDFRRDAIAEYTRAGSLEQMCRLGSRQLNQAERDHFEVSLAGKLLDLTSYRPFELDLGDCKFIRRALRKHMSGLAPANRAELRRMRTGAAARLLSGARLAEAAALVQPQLYPEVLSHLAFRTLAPHALRRLVQRAIGRADFVK